MGDPNDKSGVPKVPGVVPAIPRLTPAIPEKVVPSQAAPRPPLSNPPPGVPPSTATPVPSIPPLPKAPGRPAVPTARQTGAFPTVPAVAPVVAPTPVPRISPLAPVPAVPPIAARSPLSAMPKVAPLLPKAAARAEPAPEAAPTDERAELDRRFRTLEQLDYFQVMGLEATAAPADIKRAFHGLSRSYHPDRFFQSEDQALRARVQAVYKRVTEAYFVLRDDSRRRTYLSNISGPDRLSKLRFDDVSEAESKAAVKKEVAEQIGTHPKGRQFFQAGNADLEAGRLSAAERNIKLALTYEPENPLYLQKLEETRAKAYEEYRRSGKGFRIE